MTGVATAAQAAGPVARCRSCHAAIWFGLTAKGKRMPLDPAPVDDGNVVMDWLEQVMDQMAGANESGPGKALPHVRVLRKGEAVDADVPRYLAHFVRCPAADRFRNRSPLSAALVDKTRAQLAEIEEEGLAE